MDIKSLLAEKICNNLPYLIIITDQRGKIIYINNMAQTTLEYTPQELINKNVNTIIPKFKFHKINKEQSFIKNRHGQSILSCLSINKFTLEKQTNFIFSIQDISEQVDIHTKNQDLIEFTKLILKHIELETDYNKIIYKVIKEISLLFNFVVGHFYKLNTSKNILINSDIFYTKHPRKYAEFIKITKQTNFPQGSGLPGTVWKEKRIINYENVYTSKNFPRAKLSHNLNIKGGVGIPLIYNGDLLGVIEVYSTEPFKINEYQLYQLDNVSKLVSIYYGVYRENNSLNLILNAAGEGIYGLDLDGNTTFANPAACKILGYKAHELIGQTMHTKIHYKYPDGTVYPKEACHMYAAFKKGQESHVKNEVLWRKDQKPVPVEYTSTPIYEHDEVAGAVVLFSDVSKETEMQKRIYQIGNLQDSYIRGKSLKSLFHDAIEYLLEYTESTVGFIATTNENPENINVYQSLRSGQSFQRKSQIRKFAYLSTCIQQAINSKHEFIYNAQDISAKNIKLPLSSRKLNSLLITTISGAKDILAVIGIANNNADYTPTDLENIKPICGTIASIIESDKYHALTDKLAITDGLTGLYNRNYFDLYFSNLLELSAKEKRKFCLLMLDLHNFKMINDTHGHIKGDQFLQDFAYLLRTCTPKDGMIARVGGDEFFILLPNLTSYQKSIKVAKKILAKTNTHNQQLNKSMVGCIPNIGIIGYPLSGIDKEQLLRRVDFALYHSKESPSKEVVFFNKELEKKYSKTNSLENAIPEGFNKQQMYCVFQPQINIENEEICGVEVLIRWHHPTLGEILPYEFIHIIEKTGKAEQLNKYVVNEAINKLSAIKIKKPLKISINISPKVQNFSLHIKEIFNIIKSRVKNEYITFCLEMTETDFINNNSQYMTHINESLSFLKVHNVDFAIDDFGVEHSSIQRLITYNFSTIKIDQVFTQKLDAKDNKSAIAVIKAIMGLSKDLGFKVIAEGAESAQQIQILKQLGCLIVQGYYYYRPLQFNNFATIMQK